MKKPVLILLCTLTIFNTFAQGQISFKDGVKYVEYITIQVSKPLVSIGDSGKVYGVGDIKHEFAGLREYLLFLGPVEIKQTFPGSKWQDPLRTTYHLAEFFRIHFPEPVPELEVLEKIRKFPRIKSANGPWLISPQSGIPHAIPLSMTLAAKPPFLNLLSL